ncbi:unnamed protein product [Acanthoscelides obtectus]|uniref:Uncharacterized protein n=1 Tax=Acanthoscelides obtectus TaxID=200917 RepID=A0A9P0KLB4_ACAOB|nr:unnamed protein product [Acanthoscelides obtectus]CAK1655792.1 hypothetical protein AOBTE_LOCUS19341 [Acanthoscelides obtectus]
MWLSPTFDPVFCLILVRIPGEAVMQERADCGCERF